jgi:hypothetical protein
VQERQIPPDVAQVRRLLLKDHADAVTNGGVPVTAAPRIYPQDAAPEPRVGCEKLGYRVSIEPAEAA